MRTDNKKELYKMISLQNISSLRGNFSCFYCEGPDFLLKEAVASSLQLIGCLVLR